MSYENYLDIIIACPAEFKYLVGYTLVYINSKFQEVTFNLLKAKRI